MVTTPDGTGGRKTIDGVGFAAGLRAVTQRTYGVGDSPLRRSARTSWSRRPMCDRSPRSTTPRTRRCWRQVWRRSAACRPRSAWTWATAEGVGANARLAEAIFRDMVNAIADDAARLLDQFIGRPATPSVLADAASAIKGVIETAYKPYLVGGDGVGYKVAVSNGADPSDNRISAVVSLKFAEEIGFVDLTINAASADQSI